jgi:transcription elongation factor Elf1
MNIKYEYNSVCCGHLYIETRNADNSQIVTKCNICGQGEYELTVQTEIETIPEPVYQASEEQVVSVRDKFISAGFTEEEINLLIQEAQTE